MDKIHSSIKRSLEPRKQNLVMLSLGITLLAVGVWLMAIYFNYYESRFYPKTYIDDINVSGLNRDEAINKIRQNLKSPINLSESSLSFFYQDKMVSAPLNQLGVNDNLSLVVDQAFQERQTKHWSMKLKQIVKQHFEPQRNYVGITFESTAIKSLIEKLKAAVDQSGEKPSAVISNQIVSINQGKDGLELSVEETWQKAHQQLLSRRFSEIRENDLKVEAIVDQPVLALKDDEIEQSKTRAEKFIGEQLTLSFEYQKINLTENDLLGLLALPDGIDEDSLNQTLEKLKAEVNRPSSNAVFKYDKETLTVTEFSPDQAGLELDSEITRNMILDHISMLENGQTDKSSAFNLPLRSAQAEITLEESNDLGIKEIIGFGESWYDHSIPNRVHNVDVTTKRIANQIVKPGAEYSFNKALGEVSAATGFRDAYIIEGGQTKLAPGGGVCQVSSTLFRSLLNAGVKISKRLPHAYRVSYYEIGNEPGFDATVYAGEVDLRFINDTPGHILVSCESDSEKLYMSCKLYGTSDGRSTEIVNYKKWDQRSPLPTVYIDDPNLAPGQLKQIDWSASGIKSEYTNVIRDKNGEIIREDYYYSNYRSWAAKYLRGV